MHLRTQNAAPKTCGPLVTASQHRSCSFVCGACAGGTPDMANSSPSFGFGSKAFIAILEGFRKGLERRT